MVKYTLQISWCSHGKILKAYLIIFQHYARKGQTGVCIYNFVMHFALRSPTQLFPWRKNYLRKSTFRTVSCTDIDISIKTVEVFRTILKVH